MCVWVTFYPFAKCNKGEWFISPHAGCELRGNIARAASHSLLYLPWTATRQTRLVQGYKYVGPMGLSWVYHLLFKRPYT